ncbi:GmrSD restriction endonuclease domain-containing protein [Streptomonospora wellingtoniae]|uniref:DUF262 domain-containing protein n=1 Tax=Streptomonospora wellingtoniae TaxID=3075544 RepID=A0ABU2KY90_9ACTN|nr:DUF262 domain-containing protein [Streptomonospora sp. DSM 45055]MDT0304279.1 DUF262 domain-containing protein [Streptomonospora sp. DSM 45055]
MHAKENNVASLLQGEKQFQVPLYQRPYTWGSKELDRFWDDIAELADEPQDAADRLPHFLGSLVLAPKDLSAGGFPEWVVVDGQQRLTTILLALCAVRDRLARDDSQACDRINEKYLINKFQSGSAHYRLLPTQADRQAFVDCIERNATAGGADPIGKAYRSFSSKLAGAEVTPEYAARMESVLSARLSVVEITADKADNVYRIFESLNDTGVKLTQADLLRNHIFMLLPQQGQHVYDDIWLPLQRMLGPTDLVQLFWLDLVIGGKDKVKQGDIYANQKKRFAELVKAGGEDGLRAELQNFKRRGERLQSIIDPDRAPAELKAPLSHLKAWGGQTAYPLVLHLLDLADRGETTRGEVVEALGYVESFMVRRMLCGIHTNNLNRIFNAAPRELEDGRPAAEAVRLYLSRKRHYWPSDEQLRDAIRQRPFYWQGRADQRTFVLRRLEQSYDSPEPVDFLNAALTIEHVMPQTPTREWLDQLAADSPGEDPKEVHERLLHTLGNITLTGQNASLSNDPFERKQQIFATSALAMNHRIAAAPRWGAQQISDRADDLACRAQSLWPGPLPDAAKLVDDRPEWVMLHNAAAALPAGGWTTYGDLAKLIGSHPQAVSSHITSRPDIASAYRVLNAKGMIATDFRWLDGRTDDPKQVLEEEGVVFDDKGRADPAQRLTAADLADLIGLDTSEVEDAPLRTNGTLEEREHRFHELLRENQAPETAEAVLALLDHWKARGGTVTYGSGTDTSCFPLVWAETPAQHNLWPVVFYPLGGRVEVVFQHLSRREPFDDISLRRELLGLLNLIPKVGISDVKLDLRPSFPMSALSAGGADRLRDALMWFMDQARR